MTNFRAFLSASYSNSYSIVEIVSTVTATILTGIISTIITMRLLIDATVLAGNILGWSVEPSLVPRSNDVFIHKEWINEYLSTKNALINAFSRLLVRNFWIIDFIVVATAGITAYLFLSKVFVQLPVLMYRLQMGPAKLYIYTLTTTWLWMFPVIFSPIFAVSLVSLWAGINFSALLSTSILMSWFIAIILLLPFIYGATYMVSGRFDYSMIFSLSLTETLYILGVKYNILGVLIGSATISLILIYESYRIIKWRWGF